MMIHPSLGRTITAVLVSLLPFGAASAHPFPEAGGLPADTLLENIVRLYDNGSYRETELEGRRLLEESGLSDSMHVQIEKYIAFSLVAQDKPQQAASHFTALLRIDSTFDLDPLLTSPKILSAFLEARERFLARKDDALKNTASSQAVEPVSFRAVVFPGWEQLHRGRTGTGAAFMAVGASSLVSTVYCEIKRREYRRSYLDATTSESAVARYRKYADVQKVEIYSAALFIAAYIFSEVDVFSNAEFSARLLRSDDHTVLALSIPF